MREADRQYAEITKILIYAALVILAAALVIRITLNPEVFTEFKNVISGELDHWKPEGFIDYVPLYAIYFINSVAPLALVIVLPALYRENVPTALLATIILVLLVLVILGVVSIRE